MRNLWLRSFRCCLVFLLMLFFAGALPQTFDRPAEAKTKKIVRKKIVRKKTIRKKIVRRKIARRVRLKKTVRRSKKTAALRVRKKVPSAARPKPVINKAAAEDDSQYPLPSRSGSVTQRYSIEEGIGGDESDSVINGLESVGADDVSVDSSKNLVTITYNNSKLTSAGIVKKLKTLGFSARRVF